MSNEPNITDIAAAETVGTNPSKHILKHLENSEKRQQEKIDKTAAALKSDLTGLTETLVDIFKQRKRTKGFSNEEPPAKKIRPQTSTTTRVNATCVMLDNHGVARANAVQDNRYVDTSDDDDISDDGDTVTILDQEHLDTEVA